MCCLSIWYLAINKLLGYIINNHRYLKIIGSIRYCLSIWYLAINKLLGYMIYTYRYLELIVNIEWCLSMILFDIYLTASTQNSVSLG